MSRVIRSVIALAILAECALAQNPSEFCYPNTPGILNCPCNNPPQNPGHYGCNNFGGGSGTGGSSLHGNGTPSLSHDTIDLYAFAENNNVFTILLESVNSNAGGITYGAGIRCVTSPLHRVYGASGFRQNNGGSAGWGMGFGDPPISIDIGAVPGLTTFFQAWYRDPNALNHCGGMNATFNVTNGVVISWNP
jgi:hypothetical protein